MKKTPWTVATTLIATPMLLLSLAACGTGTAESASSSAHKDKSASAGSADETTSGGDPDKVWNLKIVKCLRDRGLDVADPKGSDFPEINGDDAAIDAGKKYCIGKLGNPPSGAGTVSPKEAMRTGLAFVKCIRKAGYEIADPTAEYAPEVPAGVPDDVLKKCLDQK